MDFQSLFNIAIALIGALGGFVLRATWDSLKELRNADKDLTDKVAKIEILVAGQYVKRDEFESKFNTLF